MQDYNCGKCRQVLHVLSVLLDLWSHKALLQNMAVFSDQFLGAGIALHRCVSALEPITATAVLLFILLFL